MSTPSDARAVAEQIAEQVFGGSTPELLANVAKASLAAGIEDAMTRRESEADARGYARGKAEGEQEAASHLERANQEIARRERTQIAYTQSEQKRLVLIDRAEAAEAQLSTARAEGKAEALREAADKVIEAKRGLFAPHTTNWDECLDELQAWLRQRTEGQGQS